MAALTGKVAVVIWASKGIGAPTTAYGRGTYVYARRGRDWKIVSAHFSPLPK